VEGGAGVDERVRAYILNVEQVLEHLKTAKLEEKYAKPVELARSYLSDAKYYYERGDYFTALACIAYAEGLLDSLNHMGVVSVNWKPLSSLLKRPRVLVAGAFEILHPGHIYLFRKAWELGEVYVVVARDKNFEKFKKRKPVVPEEQRRVVVESVKYVSRAVLGDEEDLFKPLLEIKPDIVLLGPDQWIEPEELERELAKRGLTGVRVLKLRNRVEGDLYSSSKIVEKMNQLTGSAHL